MALVDELGVKLVLNVSSLTTKLMRTEQASTVIIGALVVQRNSSQRKCKSFLWSL